LLDLVTPLISGGGDDGSSSGAVIQRRGSFSADR